MADKAEVQIGIRFPGDVLREVRKLAARHRLSLNSEVVKVMREQVQVEGEGMRDYIKFQTIQQPGTGEGTEEIACTVCRLSLPKSAAYQVNREVADVVSGALVGNIHSWACSPEHAAISVGIRLAETEQQMSNLDLERAEERVKGNGHFDWLLDGPFTWTPEAFAIAFNKEGEGGPITKAIATGWLSKCAPTRDPFIATRDELIQFVADHVSDSGNFETREITWTRAE